ncbi:N-acetylmuramoyl-L-alanine amidase [Pasteurella oralis]|uniref:N-acetylmuramoyl-L-alanine amidase n=1 Tax=Pasteurella oralis TaxID=1071947 RepID=A0ABW4NTL1_9PAST
MFPIQKIVIHCSATQNGKALHNDKQTAAMIIDHWHKKQGYQRGFQARTFNPHLKHIGYHFIIDCDGSIETGRKIGEIGAHVRGHNKHSIGICLVGGIGSGDEQYYGRFTAAQWHALYQVLQQLTQQYPDANIYGHRDLSPDHNGDGVISQHEWLKQCPCFDVWSWLDSEQIINVDHLFDH